MPLIIDPPAQAASCVIWLHGLGADSSDFYSIVPELNLPANHHTRFIFPDAPIRPITINGGMRMRGWYDIYSLDFAHTQDYQGLVSSKKIIEDLITQQINLGINSTQIILAGFSQGAAVSLYAGLCAPMTLAGIIALSGYLPIQQQFLQERTPANFATKIFQAHGLYDPVVYLEFGKQSVQMLQTLGYPVDFHTYDMEHTLCMQEIDEIAHFIKEVLYA